MRASVASFLLAATAASVANAHFTLDSPTSFGFDEDKEGDVPCGGYTLQGATRSPWYYKGGPVQIDSHHDTATVNIRISYAANPTTAQDFLSTPALKSNLALKGQGEFCFHVDASQSGSSASPAAAGTNATLLIEFISTVHGALYQCAAVTFVDTAAAGAGANLTCTDALTASPSANPDGEDNDTSSVSGGATSTTLGATTVPSGSTTSAPAASSSTNNGAAARRAGDVSSGLVSGAALLLALGSAAFATLF
ncbi:hypothetical protein OC846_003142 [Tilletia horrida]|uniref:Copper acquisition factor BIM1-like domain-containing protein n=1 Tax=Tilletia horrida TaxID=155126 RepID=A0AAN6GVH0_9BASI|nr:hypothetical protein OC845_003782 [Tilletia horrida]KAK0551856.1 hypothetical protein OC846_003142 [Tilletia horrida]KAK0561095.1 hypothetical protein OC861_005985 [Tilletia horrida]